MKYLMVLVVLMFSACTGARGPAGSTGSNCHVLQATNGAVISCDDGSLAAVTDGVGLVSTSTPAPADACANGGYEVIISRDYENLKVWNENDLFQTMFLVCNGTNGENGTDAAIQTPVQLCPNNAATNYGLGIFSEIAFCFNNKLYGVYSQNGGFQTEIPPGTWTSNGINSSCTFTVSSNCQVVQD